VHALRNIHTALVPGGITVDTQPVSPRPTVTAGGVELGTGDMRQWVATVHHLDDRAAEMIRNGCFRLAREDRFMVTDSFSSGPECLETMTDWRGTQVPSGLARRLAAVEGEVQLHQQVRLRLLNRRQHPTRRADGPLDGHIFK
jgi:hypothetical protein